MLTPERLSEIRERCDTDAREEWRDWLHLAYLEDVPELLAEVERLRAELAHHHCESCDGSAPECWRDKRTPEGAPTG